MYKPQKTKCSKKKDLNYKQDRLNDSSDQILQWLWKIKIQIIEFCKI